MPRNLLTKNPYNGFNLLALYLDTLTNSFKGSLYATFNFISKAGGKLRKGSKGVTIEFFTMVFKHKENGKIYTADQVQNLTLAASDDLIKHRYYKNYVVFNSNQIGNLEELDLHVTTDEPGKLKFYRTGQL